MNATNIILDDVLFASQSHYLIGVQSNVWDSSRKHHVLLKLRKCQEGTEGFASSFIKQDPHVPWTSSTSYWITSKHQLLHIGALEGKLEEPYVKCWAASAPRPCIQAHSTHADTSSTTDDARIGR